MSRVIRGDGGRIVRAELTDAKEQAEDILRQAEQRASEIVTEAEVRARAIEENARREGKQKAELEMAAVLAAAHVARDGALARAEESLRELALLLASRIVQEEIALHPDKLANIVRDALQRVRRAEWATLRVHPDDRVAAEPVAKAWGAAISIESDPSIARGGCVVISSVGEVDARVETQLTVLRAALFDEGEK